MATAITPRRDWIASEFSKGIEAEQELIDEARARAESPPDPSMQVLYHEIAEADERHRGIVETIATRYGHTPSRSLTGGIGETLGRLRDRVGEMVSAPLQRVSHDLAAKANSVHWYTAWVNVFEAIGDAESSRELAAILTEEAAHRDALQTCLNRILLQGATGQTVA